VKRTTTIRINGERWNVPRGFGEAYKREAAGQIADTLKGTTVDEIADLMLLIGYAPTQEAIRDWPLRKRVEAVVYAATVHLRASDHAIQRHPELPWLPKPWQGPRAGEGIFAGPSPTEITA
jgi:hypothetical protein